MKKLSTKIFIYSSVAFGIFGILFVLTMPGEGLDSSDPFYHIHIVIAKLLFTTVFIILPSFALSVASKYLSDKS
jgi:hypothetical protein